MSYRYRVIGFISLAVGALLLAAPLLVVSNNGAWAAQQPTAPPTNTPRATALPTNTPRPLPTLEPSPTSSPSPSPSATPSPTITPLPSATPTATATEANILPTPTLYYPPDFSSDREQPTAIPTAMPRYRSEDLTGESYELLNILLLGHDGEVSPGDPNFRTDTMIIVSVNRDTNTVSMVSLPRDLFVYIPNWGMGRLNTAYGYGEAIGWTDGGWGLLRQAILYNFGIETHYYAMVDFSGFEQIVDTLDGVSIAVDCPLQDYVCDDANFPECTDGIPDNEPDEAFILQTLDVGVYQMNGEDALWYARSRRNTTDFDRGRRQQQLLRGIWSASKSSGVISDLPQLWDQVTGVVQTNLPLSEVIVLLPLALSVEPNDIENHFFRKNVETAAWQPAVGPYAGQFVQIPDPNGGMVRMIENFLSPPTQNRLVLENARIEIYNGTPNENWDWVATDRLIWEGFAPIPAGPADRQDYAETVIYDYTGQTKGSSLNDLVKVLNIRPENIFSEPDPNRTTDFKIILGANYNSCVGREWVDPATLN